MISLNVTQLRNAMQLPERPFEDVFDYDGSKYYDLSQREPCTILTASGTASNTAKLFSLGVDYALNNGCIDWSIGSVKPDLYTPFYIDYTYSRLSASTASTCVANAITILQNDLRTDYPYGSTTVNGFSYDAGATYAAALIAAREACYTLATNDVDLSQKIRRGSVLIDDTKKTQSWDEQADRWNARYKKYRIMVNGMNRAFELAGPSVDRLLFGAVEAEVFDNIFLGYSDGYANGGVI